VIETTIEPGTRVRSGLRVYLLLAVGIQLLLALFYIAKSKSFVFADIGTDTFFCFYPLQMAISHQLHELHQITWSFELGLGGFLGSLVDPLLLFFGWLPDSWQLPLRLPMFGLRSVVGGGFLFGYFRLLGFRPTIAVIGGLGYAFSSYAMINAQWEVMHGTEFMQFGAYLFFLEWYLRRHSYWAGVCAGVAIGLGHPLGLYMFALFTLPYALVRIFGAAREQRLETLKSLLMFGLWTIVGLAITAPLLLPATYYLLESPRVFGSHSQIHGLLNSLIALNDRATIASEIGGLVGKDLFNVNGRFAGWGNYFEAPSFYVGLLPLLCIPQLMAPTATRRERLLFLIGVTGIALYFVWPALRYAVYGFGHVAFRFSTLWISVLILALGLTGLRRALLSAWWRPGIALGVAGIFLIVIGALVSIPATVNFEYILRVLAFTGVYATFALWMSDRRFPISLGMYCLLAVVVCELLTFAIPPVVERDAVNADGFSQAGRYDDDTVQALAFIRQHDTDSEFFRIEKTYDSVFLDDSLIQRYSGTQSYYFHASSITRFVDHLGLPRTLGSASYIGSMVDRRDIIDVVGVRYVLSRDREPSNWRDMKYVTTVGTIAIFRNETAHPFAAFYGQTISETRADSMLATDRDAVLLTTAVVENPGDVAKKLQMLGSKAAAPELPQHATIRKVRDDKLSGDIETSSPSLLMFSMPFDRGWEAHLDGAPIDLFRADFGLTAALIPAGTHTINLEYAPPGRALGIWLMVVALALLAVLAARARLQSAQAPQRRQTARGNAAVA
jgi:uncharacterized membrane protein YfhO